MRLRVLDRHIRGVSCEGAGEVERLDDIERLEAVAAVHVDPEFDPRRAGESLGGTLDVKIVSGNVGALDTPSGRRGGEPILIGALLVGAQEGGELHLPETGDIRNLVRRAEAVGVLERIVEAHRSRIVPRPLEVTPEVALPAGGEESLRHRVAEVDQEPLVFPAGVEDLAVWAVVVFGVAHVRLDEHAAARKPFRDLERCAAFRDAGADRAAEARA